MSPRKDHVQRKSHLPTIILQGQAGVRNYSWIMVVNNPLLDARGTGPSFHACRLSLTAQGWWGTKRQWGEVLRESFPWCHVTVSLWFWFFENIRVRQGTWSCWIRSRFILSDCSIVLPILKKTARQLDVRNWIPPTFLGRSPRSQMSLSTAWWWLGGTFSPEVEHEPFGFSW